MNLDDEMCNHANLDQLIYDRAEPLRNQCNMNNTRNRTNKMGAVATYHYNPPLPPVQRVANLNMIEP